VNQVARNDNRSQPSKHGNSGGQSRQVVKRAPISSKTAKVQPTQRSKGNDRRSR